MKLIFIVVAVLFFKNSAVALDSSFDTCSGGNLTTQSQLECLNNASISWDLQLNNIYKALMKKLSSSEQEKLRSTQREWVIFKEKEIEFINLIFAMNPLTKGTIVQLYRLQFILDLTKQRALLLEEYLKGYEDSLKE
jgi:uncharacterized protein YecT (DUF1311 family)